MEKFAGRLTRVVAMALAVMMLVASVPAVAATSKYTTRFELSKDHVEIIQGKTAKVTLTVWGVGTADKLGIRSPDENIASRSEGKQSGKKRVYTIKGIAPGETEMTFVSTPTGPVGDEPLEPITATVTIVVLPKKASAPESIELNETELTLTKGKKFTLSAVVVPSHPKQKKAIWKSDNPKVASVGSKGKVTAKKEGTATITARIKGTELMVSCVVTVLPRS